MEVMYPSSAEIVAIVYNLILFRAIPAIVFLAALYFVIRKAVRDAFKDAKNRSSHDPNS